MNRPSGIVGGRNKEHWTSGVYQIRNLVNGKCYVGSSNNIGRRYLDHMRELSRGTHSNPRLQLSWNKHGGDSFEFSVLFRCPENVLPIYEQMFINDLQPFYNIAKDVGFPATPKPGTPEAKLRGKKVIESRRKSERCNSPEFHQMMSEIMVGRWKNLEYREVRSSDTQKLWGDPKYRERQKHAHRKLDTQTRKLICELHSAGHTKASLSRKFGVTYITIVRVIQGLN